MKTFYRVQATIIYEGEWFVAAVDADSPEAAIEYVKRNAEIEEPENYLSRPHVSVDPKEVWLADEDGSPLSIHLSTEGDSHDRP